MIRGGERDLLAREAVRVAVAVDALVVGEDDLGDRAVAVDPARPARALLGVALDDLELLVRELRVGEAGSSRGR